MKAGLNGFRCVLVFSMFRGIFTNNKLELRPTEAVTKASHVDTRRRPHVPSGTTALIKNRNCF